jgi:two-component system NarL family sensor kinase
MPRYLFRIGVLLFVFVANYTYASNGNDSIARLIATSENKAEVINASIELGKRYVASDFDKCISIANNALALCNDPSFIVQRGILLQVKGTALYFKGDFNEAAKLYFASIHILETNNSPRDLAHTYEVLARLYRKTRELNLAIEIYDKAKNIFISINDSTGISTIFNESGVVFEYKGDYDEAYNRYYQSLLISSSLKDTVAVTYAMNNIGTLFILQKKYSFAENYLLQTLKIRESLHDNFSIAISHSDLGALYSAWQKFDLASLHYQKSIDLAKSLKYRELLSQNYLQLSSLLHQKGKNNEAYKYYNKHIALKDSLFNEAKSKQLYELQTQYETGKKDLEIGKQSAELKRKQILLTFAIVSFGAILIILILFYNRYKLKQKAKHASELLTQQEQNNRSIIEAEEKERIRIARELHDGIGQQLSALKMNLSALGEFHSKHSELLQMLDDSVKEVRSVSHNLMPNALIYAGLAEAVKQLVGKLSGSSIHIHLQIVGFEQRFATTTETVLYRVLQECLSNIIKHAQATEINISLVQHDAHLNMLIEDNGKGFDTKKLNQFEGIGLKNIVSRVQFLNGVIEFDSTPSRGTTVIIDIPLL